jgi:hypothetical protein
MKTIYSLLLILALYCREGNAQAMKSSQSIPSKCVVIFYEI